MSGDARILYNVLDRRLVNDGEDFIPYADLTAAVQRNVQTQAGRGILATARRNIEREHNILIECVRGEGLKRSEAYAGTLTATRRHVRRISRRTLRRVHNAAASNNVSDAEQMRISVESSLLGVINLFTSKTAEHRIEKQLVASADTKELPTMETLRLFANNGPSK